jgi:hypothetical protein
VVVAHQISVSAAQHLQTESLWPVAVVVAHRTPVLESQTWVATADRSRMELDKTVNMLALTQMIGAVEVQPKALVVLQQLKDAQLLAR